MFASVWKSPVTVVLVSETANRISKIRTTLKWNRAVFEGDFVVLCRRAYTSRMRSFADLLLSPFYHRTCDFLVSRPLFCLLPLLSLFAVTIALHHITVVFLFTSQQLNSESCQLVPYTRTMGEKRCENEDVCRSTLNKREKQTTCAVSHHVP